MQCIRLSRYIPNKCSNICLNICSNRLFPVATHEAGLVDTELDHCLAERHYIPIGEDFALLSDIDAVDACSVRTAKIVNNPRGIDMGQTGMRPGNRRILNADLPRVIE